MPTAYTSIIGDRESISFKEFAMRCARGMGACISMRDDSLDAPIPDRFEPSVTYYAEREKEAREQIAIFEAMSADGAARAADEEFQKTIARVNSANEQTATLCAKYEKMIAEVRAWVPPTSDHDGLKSFMLEQLERSMSFDCHIATTPERVPPEQWQQAKLGEAYADLSRAHRMRAEEIDRTASRNKWLAALRSSLEERG
jgi:hypothetical protein